MTKKGNLITKYDKEHDANPVEIQGPKVKYDGDWKGTKDNKFTNIETS